MVFIKKHKGVFLIIGGILLIFGMVFGGACGFFLVQSYRAQKEYDANALSNPFINLQDLEKDFWLIRETYTPGIKSFEVIDAHLPYEPKSYTQVYDGYLLQDKNAETSNYISLSSYYWYITNGFTSTDIIENSTIRFFMNQAEIIKDSRFDISYIGNYGGMFTREEYKYSLVVIKNRHIIMLHYKGGHLTPEDFLNELARIL